MIIIYSSDELKKEIKVLKQKGKSIGFVPTMGYLHKGHMEVISKSKKENDITIVSIFVNRAQFNEVEDFEKYPRNEKDDSIKCEEIGTDILFLPSEKDIYPEEDLNSIQLRIPSLMNVLCGKSRPGHFEGVLLVLSKLFHVVLPERAYFGMKDYQQYKIDYDS